MIKAAEPGRPVSVRGLASYQPTAASVRGSAALRDVSLRYFSPQGETVAIAGVDLAIAAGEFVALIGPSGCGKSTLLSIIAGILAPSAGSVEVDGVAMHGPSPRVGYMLQQDYLLEWRTILENTVLGAEIQHRDLSLARERAAALLREYGLGDFLHAYPRELSGGMRQRAALVRTLVTEPELVLLDEPFSALDFQTRLTLADDVVTILRQECKTVIMVTHDLGEAISMSDRVIVLTQRPARVKAEHIIRFAGHGEHAPAPFARRSLPEFNDYFATLWHELDLHPQGATR